MQTILGSGGAIGVELTKALTTYTQDIRLVSRHPEKVNETDQLMQADLLREADVFKAVEGSDIVYVTVGFPYNLKVWTNSWPPFIRNVIQACKEHDCKLVFFDNIYMYDAGHLNGMNEQTPINPPSKKGGVRQEVAQRILDEIERGNLNALIARSADFYGPSIEQTSVLTETVFKPLSIGKKANWMGSVDFKHSFTYTPDAGKATALLGNTPDAFNQVWHLPTASEPPTGKEWIQMIAEEFEAEPKYQAAPKWLVRIIGLFVPIMKELVEMMYQYDRDYVFNSDKFEQRFKVAPTPYVQGIKEVIDHDYRT